MATSPVRGASLYRLFAESLAATRRRSRSSVPWLLMTSDATDRATREHLDAMGEWLGGGTGYRTFTQGTRPVLDEGGRLVIPVGAGRSQILQRWYRDGDRYDCDDLVPVAFVPMIGTFGWKSH